jgi:hypothetical protein
MIFIVEFADGTSTQIRAGSALDARKVAIANYRDRLVVAVRQAGLDGMGYRQPPLVQPQKS